MLSFFLRPPPSSSLRACRAVLCRAPPPPRSVLGASSRLLVRVHPRCGVRGCDGVDRSAVVLSRQKRHRHPDQGVWVGVGAVYSFCAEAARFVCTWTRRSIRAPARAPACAGVCMCVCVFVWTQSLCCTVLPASLPSFLPSFCLCLFRSSTHIPPPPPLLVASTDRSHRLSVPYGARRATVRGGRVRREPRAGLHRRVWLRDGDQGRRSQHDCRPVGWPRVPGEGGKLRGDEDIHTDMLHLRTHHPHIAGIVVRRVRVLCVCVFPRSFFSGVFFFSCFSGGGQAWGGRFSHWRNFPSNGLSLAYYLTPPPKNPGSHVPLRDHF